MAVVLDYLSRQKVWNCSLVIIRLVSVSAESITMDVRVSGSLERAVETLKWSSPSIMGGCTIRETVAVDGHEKFITHFLQLHCSNWTAQAMPERGVDQCDDLLIETPTAEIICNHVTCCCCCCYFRLLSNLFVPWLFV